MPHSIPEFIQLNGKFNKPVKKGKPRKITAEGRDETAYRITGTTDILDKPIQIYRQWYRFLQLAIELEEKNVTIITEEVRHALPKKQRDKYGHWRETYLKPTKHKVKINWSKYKDWGHAELIANTDFNAWWKTHRQLFFQEMSTFVKSKKDWVEDDNYKYIKIDKRKKANAIFQNWTNKSWLSYKG